MAIKKQFLKSKPGCKVSFRVSSAEANGAEKIQIIGSFNNWDKNAEPMNALKSGDFTQTLELESGKEYQFRYLLDGKTWANDSEADSKITNEFNELNDVVVAIQ